MEILFKTDWREYHCVCLQVCGLPPQVNVSVSQEVLRPNMFCLFMLFLKEWITTRFLVQTTIITSILGALVGDFSNETLDDPSDSDHFSPNANLTITFVLQSMIP